MLSILKKEEILEAAVVGIPRVAQAIGAVPSEHRARALAAAERSYLQTLQDLGYSEPAARKWVSAVMLHLRAQTEDREFAKR